MAIKSQPTIRHHTLEQILDIDFDGLSGPDDEVTTSISTPTVTTDNLAQFNLSGLADPNLVAPHTAIESDYLGPASRRAVPPFLSLGAAAEWLAVSLSTVKRMVGRGDLATVRIGERRKIPLATLNNYALVSLTGGVPGCAKFPRIINKV